MKTNYTLSIFVVEDNEWYGELLVHQLAQNPHHQVRRFASARACLAHIGEGPDLVTLDYRLPDASCEELLRQLHEQQPGIATVVISGQEDIGTAVKLLRLGAFDYLVKDAHTFDRLQHSVARLAEQVRLRRENACLRQK